MFAGKEFADFDSHVQKVKQLARRYRKEPQVWIQAFKIKAEHEGDVKKAVQVAYRTGISKIMAWSYLGTAYMSSIHSERPEKVWQALKKAYLEVRKEQTAANRERSLRKSQGYLVLGRN